MTNIVKRKVDNVVTYIGGIGSFIDTSDSNFFIIEGATAEWGLPIDGWFKEDYEFLSEELEIPADYQYGIYSLTGTVGNWTWTLV